MSLFANNNNYLTGPPNFHSKNALYCAVTNHFFIKANLVFRLYSDRTISKIITFSGNHIYEAINTCIVLVVMTYKNIFNHICHFILPFFELAVSMSKCNKVEFIGPVGFEVKSILGKEEFRRTFPT